MVSDKKMLWRANLYIDEPRSNAPGSDWNNIHPWNAPMNAANVGNAPAWWSEAWGYNDWNNGYQFQNEPTFNIFNMTADDTLGNTPGGQRMTPHTFVWANGSVYTGRVAYDYNGMDNPFGFNNKMDQQRLLLGQYFNTNGSKFLRPKRNWPATFPSWASYHQNVFASPPAYQGSYDGSQVSGLIASWDQILPPEIQNGNRYKNYIAVSQWGDYTYGTINACDSYPDGNAYPWAPDNDQFWTGTQLRNLTETDFPWVINGYTCYPYLPGLNNSQWNYNPVFGFGSKIDLPNHAGKAAGTDCVAFVMNSAGYRGNRYTVLPELVNPETGGNPSWWSNPNRDNSNVEFIATDDDLDLISERAAGVLNPNTNTMEYPNLEYIVPGDIFYYTNYHVGIVAWVDNTDGTVGINHIKIIESTANNGWEVYFVTKRNTVIDYNTGAMARTWVIGRLKQ
jgi:hypothetical protein